MQATGGTKEKRKEDQKGVGSVRQNNNSSVNREDTMRAAP